MTTKRTSLAAAVEKKTSGKLPVPPPRASAPEIDTGIPAELSRGIMSLDQQREALTKLNGKAERTPQSPRKKDAESAEWEKAKSAVLEARKERDKERSRVRIQKLKAKQSGEAKAMPLEGKAALAKLAETDKKQTEALTAIASSTKEMATLAQNAIEHGHPITHVPQGVTADSSAPQPAHKPAKARKVESKPASPPKKQRKVAPSKATAEGDKPKNKTALIADMLRRKEGCTTAEVLAATGWPAVSMPQQARVTGITLRKDKQPGQPTRYFAA